MMKTTPGDIMYYSPQISLQIVIAVLHDTFVDDETRRVAERPRTRAAMLLFRDRIEWKHVHKRGH